MTDPAKTNVAAGDAAGVADEFAHVPSSRARHPAVAAAGAALAFFLVFHVRHDLRYALSPGAPVDLGAARALFASDRAARDLGDRFVRVAGTPDRESALEIDTKGSWVFSQFFRVLGTNARLYLHRRESPLPAARAETDVFEGRLIRVDDLSFADSIRAYFAAHVSATRFFAPDVFARALAARRAGAPSTVVDLAGDAVALAGDEPLAIEVVPPDEVQIGLPRARFAAEADARAAIVAAGGEPVTAKGLIAGVPPANAPAAGPLSATPPPPERWTFVVRFPAATRQAALDRLADLDRAVEIRDARDVVTARFADVDAAEGGANIVVRAPGAPARRVPIVAIATVHTLAPVLIPADAYLLVEGDSPREHLPIVLVALMLVMFGAVNLVGVFRGRARA